MSWCVDLLASKHVGDSTCLHILRRGCDCAREVGSLCQRRCVCHVCVYAREGETMYEESTC